MRGHDLINTFLPDELMVEIFGHLATKSSRDACSLVCRRWLRLERLSRSTLRIGASASPDIFLHLLPSRFSNLRNLHIDERLSIPLPLSLPVPPRRRPLKVHCVANNTSSAETNPDSLCLSDAGLAALGEGLPRLERLSLIWCSNVSSDGLKSLAYKCTFLKSLDLQGCFIGDQGLAAIGQCCKQLEDLNLRFCEGLTDSGFTEFALGVGKSMKSLGVAACAKITDVSMEAVGSYCRSLETLTLDSEYIHDKGVHAVAQGCPHLKVLKLQCVNLTDDALKSVGAACLSLELLALYSFQRFTDKGLRAIGKGCKKLKNLTLIDCYYLTDKGLEAIATGCKELTHLEVNGCHNIGTIGLESIGKSCKCNHGVDLSYVYESFKMHRHLTELALLYCQRIGNIGLLKVGQGCKFLQALHLVDCSGIGDEAICSIAKGCRSLKKLHIRRCYEIGTKGIIAVGEHCNLLTDLSIRFCDRVGDEALIAVSEGCNLQYLNVSGCHLVGDAGVIAIARGCPQLCYLDVSVLPKLGDMAMVELGENCPLLKEIVLSHSRQITDVGLAHLVKSCTMLESCHMVYCSGITSAGVATVVSSCPNIKKVLVEKWKVSQRTKRRAGSVIAYLCVDL
ncbi:F-box/LRR-repeat protein 4-like isoform X1 [Arachis stenosperma]|uniref:F-box/LRR-repeat protein 4-like isoform X1 n=1 Tax=Arachis stenosperma TaxID=217475 RepID=UPI0025ABDAC9|nr:F-box/LRR-repeat protein 4-like isoform X1 [Arachis stenosperma]